MHECCRKLLRLGHMHSSRWLLVVVRHPLRVIAQHRHGSSVNLLTPQLHLYHAPHQLLPPDLWALCTHSTHTINWFGRLVANSAQRVHKLSGQQVHWVVGHRGRN